MIDVRQQADKFLTWLDDNELALWDVMPDPSKADDPEAMIDTLISAMDGVDPQDQYARDQVRDVLATSGRLDEITAAGPIGTPFDTASLMPGESTVGPRSEEDKVFYLVGDLLTNYFKKMSQDDMARLEKMAKEQRHRHIINAVGLEVKNDLHWDTMAQLLPQYMARKASHLKKYGARRGVNEVSLDEAVNNPEELSHDDAVTYLGGLSDAAAELINDLHITDPDEGEEEVILAGTSIYQALVQLGEEEGEPEAVDDYDDDYSDDPWHPDGPYWEREYEFDETPLLELTAEKDPETGEFEMEDNMGDGMVPAQQWMEQTGYDLYWDIPMNIRRPDGQPFEVEDVDAIDNWFREETKGMRKYAPNIKLELRPQTGETSTSPDWYFY